MGKNKMTRNQVEHEILKHLQEVNRLAREYGTKSLLSLAIFEDGHISCNSEYYNLDSGAIINFTKWNDIEELRHYGIEVPRA
ncbi:MAG TPA: hypothetical protein PLP25_00130 [Candidatus Limiplasma sp.]|nr:hypothetical protein [Candidatus Limiplasma sp.]